MHNPALYPLSPPVPAVRRTPVPRPENARALAALLLAAMVAALVVVADHFISTWADGHLFLAWVALWAVVFAATALLAAPARRLAQRAMQGLDAWARDRAQARAEARLWDLAKSDHRVMAELVQARARDAEAQAATEAALAPLGLDNGVVLPRRATYLERLAAQKRNSNRLYYI
jgi:hypothetical protein